MFVEGFGRLRNSLDLIGSRFSARTCRGLASALFACACASLLGYATFSVFFKDVIARTEGKQPIAIAAFAHGATVTHAFLMDGDSLHAVSVRIAADQPSSLSVACKLLRLYDGDPEAESLPNRYTEIYRWTGRLLVSGDQWRRIDFPSVGESNNKWYAFEIRALSVTPTAGPQQTDGTDAAVSLMASDDNPDRGGKLWIDGTRQPGSLFILAHSGTLYEQLGLGDPWIWPGVFRNRAFQAVLLLAAYGGFAALAYRMLFGRAGRDPIDSAAVIGSHHAAFPRSPKEPWAADQRSQAVNSNPLVTIAFATSVLLALCGLFVAPGNAEHAIPLVPEALLLAVLMFGIAAWVRTREASQQNSSIDRTERFLLKAAFCVVVFWTFPRLLGALSAAPGSCTHVAPSLIAKAECFLRAADGENWGIKNFSTLILTLAVTVASACWVRVGARNWRALAFAVIGVCVLHAVLGFVAVFSGATQLLPKWLVVNPWGRERFTFVIPNPSWVWPHLAPGLAWVLWFALSVPRWPRLFPISGAVVLSVAIVSTKQRGGLLLLVLLWGCAALMWVSRQVRSREATTGTTFVRLSGFLLCYAVGAMALVAWLVSRWSATGRMGMFSDQRVPMWSLALNALRHHDVLWGFGYASWYSAFRKIVAGTENARLGFGTAHNFWVQLVFEHGLLGFLIITSLMLLAVFVAFQNVKFKPLGRELLFLQLIVVLTCTMVQVVDDVRPVLMTYAVTWGTLLGMPFRSPWLAGSRRSEGTGLSVLRRQTLGRNALGAGLCVSVGVLACLMWFAQGAFGFDGDSTLKGPVTRWLGKEATIPVFGPAPFWLFETGFAQKQGSFVLARADGPPLSLVVKKGETAYLTLRSGTRLFPKRHRLYVSPGQDEAMREISANIVYPPRAGPNLLPLLLTRNASQLIEEGTDSWIECASTCEMALDAGLLEGFVPVLEAVVSSNREPAGAILWGVRFEDSPHVELPARPFTELQFDRSDALSNANGFRVVLPVHHRTDRTLWVLLAVEKTMHADQSDTRVVRVRLMPRDDGERSARLD